MDGMKGRIIPCAAFHESSMDTSFFISKDHHEQTGCPNLNSRQPEIQSKGFKTVMI
jgi:hypothetical protein